MQQANCHVRLNGDVGNEVFKSGITPAELLILQSIHGEGSVLKVEPQGMDKRPHASEIERLKTEYGEGAFKAVFPGHTVQLPVSFRDVGVDVNSDETGPVTAKTKAKKSATAPHDRSFGDDLSDLAKTAAKAQEIGAGAEA